MVALNGRPESSITSRARTIRRPLLGRIAAAAGGSAAASLACSTPGPTAASSDSRRARSAGSVPGNRRSSMTALMYRPEPPTRIAVRPRSWMSAITARASRWYSDTLAVWVTSQMSSR